jgi:energy-converting hydrogenase A subunit R
VKRVFISDCEGPISRNDNAFEITARFVPDGDRLFTLISKYDDALADVLKKPGYSAGSTLKLILPFLRAYNITDKLMEEFSAKNLILIANSKETLRHVRTIAISIDKYAVTTQEKARLRELAQEIAQMKLINIPPAATSIQDFSVEAKETITRLDEIFWTEIPKMSIGKVFSEVTTVGGEQKAEAIADILSRLQARLSDVMYVGDSITDVEAFKLVKENDGLTVSFNGNSYAVKNAEVAVQSENSTVTSLIADLFCAHGREGTLQVLENWNREALRKSQVSQPLLDKFLALYPEALPKVQIVTPRNMELIAKESSEFRKKVRGEAIGKLG